jgi:hypothetical protein
MGEGGADEWACVCGGGDRFQWWLAFSTSSLPRTGCQKGRPFVRACSAPALQAAKQGPTARLRRYHWGIWTPLALFRPLPS